MSTSMLKRVTPYLITLALAVFLYMQADRFPILSSARMPGPDLWPKMICVLLAAVSLIGLVGAAFASGEAQEAEPVDEALASPPETHPYLVWVGVAATGMYVGAMPYLGFFIATVLFAAALLLIGGMRRWAWLAPTAFVLSGVFTLLFMKVVYVSLPLGAGGFKQVSLLVFKLMGIH